MVMRVVIVMPPVTALEPAAALDHWQTLTGMAEALQRGGEVEPTVVCRTSGPDCVLVRRGITYVFAPTDERLVEVVVSLRPDVVHLHGLGFSRLIRRLGRMLRGVAPIVVQHHGEQLTGLRSALGHRLARSAIAAYLFTGAAHGQCEPFVRRRLVRADAVVIEVLESASLLPAVDTTRSDPVSLEGLPAVLWVGRLIESKDPLTAVAAFAAAAASLPDGHLHLLATDRALEPEVRAAIVALGDVGSSIHVHAAVPHAEMPAWYAAAGVYFSTSHREGSNYSLIEALTRGCVPVVTAIPSHRAIVGGLAPMFAAGDVDAAAQLLIGAPAIDRHDVIDHSHEHLTWSCVAQQLTTAYGVVRRDAAAG
jgi:glycosyltransferase involved in cell wall biosynthesis